MSNYNNKNIVLAAIILGIAIIAATFLFRYMSPYQTCFRELVASGDYERAWAAEECLNK